MKGQTIADFRNRLLVLLLLLLLLWNQLLKIPTIGPRIDERLPWNGGILS